MNSAVVMGCGHASFLMDISVVRTTPHVHLHFLTDNKEYAELGYGKIELCCHGCGASLLMYCAESQAQKRAHILIRDEFVSKHIKCPPYIFNGHCPNWRTKFEMVDIRRGIEIQSQEWQIPSEKRDKSLLHTS
jgi:hypothetical protein